LGKIKFGVFLPFYAFKAKNPIENFNHIKNLVLESERLGYDSVWLDDHLMYGSWPILESWTTLAALVSVTNKIKVGTMVSCNIHRNPALLAKAAATIDVLSNGRLEFGMGTGAQESEHEAYGFSFPEPKIRVEMMSEALEVIIRLWTKDKADYQGKHYKLKEAICEPKPTQKPHPPIIVGGSGERFTLKATAKYANRFDWGHLPSIQEYREKLKILQKHCTNVGRDFNEIEKSCWPAGQILIAESQKELEGKIAKIKPKEMTVEDFGRTTLATNPEECFRLLEDYIDLGVTYFMLFFADLPKSDSLSLFAKVLRKKL
jgi:alkanesulfonate monooxygenase SsuD/methylene tetrahydromethanopterin reductase-like flavin-dependent oxidoreductase (luciferase family)